MSINTPARTSTTVIPQWLWLLTAVAILTGLYGRFKGLGLWPLGVDEFYISRSIDNLMRTGLPQFPCGGYYTRGILYQYTVALLRSTGLTPEFAGRVVTATCSLLVLPATYLLVRRLHSRAAGLLAVIVLSISVWEIEMARFARMYAPFQAVFAWYLVYFVRYTVDGHRRALIGMVALSILGVLSWEGGALIGLANLLPPFINSKEGRLKREDWWYLAGMMLLFALLYASTTDFRGFSSVPALPEDQAADLTEADSPKPLFFYLKYHLKWLFVAIIPFGLGVGSTKWLWSLRRRWLAALGLGAALVAALLGQLLICASVLLLLLTVQLIKWNELTAKPAVVYVLALLSGAVFWFAFGWFTSDWHSGVAPNPMAALALLARQLAGFPNVFDQIIKPWGGAIPTLSILLFLALVVLLCTNVIKYQSPEFSAVRALLILLLILGLAVGAAKSPRYETRYSFFLYPLLVTFGILCVSLATDLLRTAPARVMAATAACLALFTLTEDFQPRHIAAIDTAATNYREGLPPRVISHYYPRNDMRSLANWLTTNVRTGDLVLSGVPNLDQYYGKVDFVFLDKDDERFTAYGCNLGTVDRWSNRPLLYGTDALEHLAGSGSKIYLILYRNFVPSVAEALKSRGWTYQQLTPVRYAGADVLVLNSH